VVVGFFVLVWSLGFCWFCGVASISICLGLGCFVVFDGLLLVVFWFLGGEGCFGVLFLGFYRGGSVSGFFLWSVFVLLVWSVLGCVIRLVGLWCVGVFWF